MWKEFATLFLCYKSTSKTWRNSGSEISQRNSTVKQKRQNNVNDYRIPRQSTESGLK